MAGENFGEFGDLLRIRQSFIRQLLVISEKAIEAGPKSAKVFFAKCNLVCNSPKPKFLLYGIVDCMTIVISSFRPMILRAKINQSNDMELSLKPVVGFDWLILARDISLA